MNERREFAQGGYEPGERVMRMLVRKDGWVSFDGPSGPWMNIMAPSEVAAQAEAAREMNGDAR